MAEKKNKAPAFQWYPKDCMTDTRVMLLSLEEEGAYRRLLDCAWLEGNRITSEPEEIMILIGKGCTIEIATKLKQFFVDIDGKMMYNNRLEKERLKQNRFLRTQKANGSKGGRPKNKKPENNPNETRGFSENNPDESQTKPLHLHSSFVFSTSTNVDESPADKSRINEKPLLTDVQKANHESFGKRFLADPEYADIRRRLKIDKIHCDILPEHMAKFNAHLLFDSKAHLTMQEYQRHFCMWIGYKDNAKIEPAVTKPNRPPKFTGHD